MGRRSRLCLSLAITSLMGLIAAGEASYQGSWESSNIVNVTKIWARGAKATGLPAEIARSQSGPFVGPPIATSFQA